MSEPTRFGQIDVRVATASGAARPVTSATPFRILVLGGFSGRGGESSKRDLRAVFVDRDNIDEVLAGFDVRLHTADGRGPEVMLARLEDFHPDALYRNVVPLLPRQSRRTQTAPTTKPAEAPPEHNPAYSVEGLFDQTLDQTERRPGEPADSWNAMIRGVGAAHAAPKSTAAERERAASNEELVLCQARILG